MLSQIQHLLFASEQFQKLSTSLSLLKEGECIVLTNVFGSLPSFILSKIFSDPHTRAGNKSQLLFIASDVARAEKIFDDCSLLSGKENVVLVSDQSHHHGAIVVDEFGNHIEALQRLYQGIPTIVVTHPSALARKIPSPKKFNENVFEIKLNEETDFKKFTDKLYEWNFEKVDFISSQGEFSIRGGIVDVFSFVGSTPIRIEFFGDEVVSLREFDALSQRSIRDVKSVSIVPNILETENDTKLFSSSLFDYLQTNGIVVLDELPFIQKEIEERNANEEEGIFSWEEVKENFKYFPIVELTNFPQQIANDKLQFAIEFHSLSQLSFNGSIDTLVKNLQQLEREDYKIFIACSSVNEKKRLEELIIESIERQSGESGVILSEVKNLLEGDYDDVLNDEDFTSEDGENPPLSPFTKGELPQTSNHKSQTHFLSESIHHGFIFPDANFVLYTEHEIFGRLKRIALRSTSKFKGISARELRQLKRGDYVVHIDYGIGKFAGLQTLKSTNGEQEVAKIIYKDDDVLYVNLNYIHRIQKYSSKDGHVPSITKLGGGEWEKIKSRAKKRIKDIARELIQLYAKRKMENGFAFSEDTHWQKEMEASFMYEDTPDQARTTSEIKMDMETPHPMDRLVCGDVGFGKTEIAVRAAFKSVQDGKQVGVLVPTTILAHQHFHTFNDRLSKYAVRVENVTRFKSKKEQKQILDALKEGKVDVLIGTHRLLSKDVEFKDLGLLVIDEEHRFGVSAKEKLREKKVNVDTLTLTATPIPRTLHFSLLGVRDLSLLSTPPKNRLPIITTICQFDRTIIREAILNELHRGGQIYFVNDHVHDLEQLILRLREYVPEAKFGVAHGQLKGHELEQVMFDFWEKKFDVLVCTKIIESGLDIPNVNTILINKADHFGMAELYQLRGRVGRSNTQAFAYLLTPPISVLPKTTLRKLQSLHEFSDLGSGFNLAMRDFEIRGAGNLLGGEQSGFIIEMGFDTYEQIMQEAVAELQEQEFSDVFKGKKLSAKFEQEVAVETDVEALFPKHYVENDSERFDMYRRLASIHTENELQKFREELFDRFGKFPDEVEHLLQLVEIRITAAKIGFVKIEMKKEKLLFQFPDESNKEFYEGEVFQKIITRVGLSKNKKLRLQQNEKELKLEIFMPHAESGSERLMFAKKFISDFLDEEK
ncbi:MAG: transcription-repair coupling factor [Ignavibacteriales bacterium]|nr:transcription-repair coupling factor [Ignavibacteriales bacterium]